MAKKIVPSGHLMEIFMPYLRDDERMLQVVRKVVSFDFYRGLELPIFQQAESRREIRDILEKEQLVGVAYSTPYMDRAGLSLCSLDKELRERSVEYELSLARQAAEMGLTYMGVPSGPDPGAELREASKEVLADSFHRVAEGCRSLGIDLLLEPLDRYAHKKKLLGPMEETCQWFAGVHAADPNTYIHWDSAHEALGKIDLMKSLDLAAPYLARIHLCNAILDESHPCFGDLHMDVGQPPRFETEGFLNPELGAAILSRAAASEVGEEKRIFASVEMLGHPGDDLWHKEYCSRMFMQACMQLSGLSL